MTKITDKMITRSITGIISLKEKYQWNKQIVSRIIYRMKTEKISF